MALYHMLNVTGGAHITAHSVGRYVRWYLQAQARIAAKQWSQQKSNPMVLSAAFVVIQNREQREREERARRETTGYVDYSPTDASDPVAGHQQPDNPPPPTVMGLFDELKIPASETLEKLGAARDRFTSSLNELGERLASEPLSTLLTEQASRLTDETDQVAESLTETFEETREALQSLTQRLVKSPEPGIPRPVAEPTPTQHPGLDIALSEEIITRAQQLHDAQVEDEDTELVPRFKAAVRQFRAELEQDESGDPPLALVSRHAKGRIEQFIRRKRETMREKLSEKLEIVREISVLGGPGVKEKEGGGGGKETTVGQYIASSLPECDQSDPEIRDLVMESAGTFYNDGFLVEGPVIEDKAQLESEGWSREVVQDHLRIWKKVVTTDDGGLTLYKIFGEFDQISAVEFYNAQVNDQYRSEWDGSVSSLYVVDNITNNREIVYWATKFPFPLKDRDYVFERTHAMTEDQISISSRSITHRAKPVFSSYVRVYKYGSNLVMRSRGGDLYEKGMSYCLTYYDDFGMPIPSQVKDKLANAKIPEFLDKVRDAAEFLGKTGKLYVPYPEPPSRKR